MKTVTKADILEKENEFMKLIVGQEKLTYNSRSKCIKTLFSSAQKQLQNTIFLLDIKNVYIISTKFV